MRGLLALPAPTAPGLDPDRRYRLDPAVALRAERFGALAYHYGTRRLTFLRSRRLAQLVAGLGDHPSLAAALAEVPEDQREACRAALGDLAASRFIQPYPEETDGDRPDH